MAEIFAFVLWTIQMLSRTKPAVGPGSGPSVSSAKDAKKKRKLPKLEDFLAARDFTGAMTLLEVLHLLYGMGPWVTFTGFMLKLGRNLVCDSCIL